MYSYTQDVPIPWQVYEQIRAELGTSPPPGLILHLVLQRDEGGLRYLDVWESKEQCERFMDERIHPAVDRVFAKQGLSRPKMGEPCQTPIQVHEVWAPQQLLEGRVAKAG